MREQWSRSFILHRDLTSSLWDSCVRTLLTLLVGKQHKGSSGKKRVLRKISSWGNILSFSSHKFYTNYENLSSSHPKLCPLESRHVWYCYWESNWGWERISPCMCQPCILFLTLLTHHAQLTCSGRHDRQGFLSASACHHWPPTSCANAIKTGCPSPLG